MKNYLLVLFAFLLLVGCKNDKKATAQAPPADITIIFIRLIDEIPEGEANIYPYIQLYDNYGNVSQSNKESIEKFTSPVYSGRRVKWKKSNVSLQQIRVKKILKKINGELELLSKQNISENENEVVRVVKTNLSEGKEEHYSIEISIGQGRHKKDYTIDPIIKYHQ